jgi:hypothetical protein
MPKMKRDYLFSFIALAVAVLILAFLVFAEKMQVRTILQDRVFYILLVLMGIFTAIAVSKFVGGSSKIAGKAHGFTVKLAGPPAVLALVVIGGFFLIPRQEYFDLTVRAVDHETRRSVFSDRKAVVTLNLPSGQRAAQFTSNGEAVIKGLPVNLLNKKSRIDIDIYYYEQVDPGAAYTLSQDVIEIPARFNPAGTAEGIRNKKEAHLMLVKLLLPYRLMDARAHGQEMSLAHFYSNEFLSFAASFDVRSKIGFSKEELRKICDVLSENAPESLGISGKTYAELINYCAVQFKRDVQLLSKIDRESLDPEIQRELIVTAGSNFVSIAAGIDPQNPEHLIGNTGFWSDFAHEIKRIDEGNKINLAVVFGGL